MKKLHLLFLLAISSLFLLPETVSATHIMGENFLISCINNCTTRVELFVYRDCIGSSSINASATTWTPQTTGCQIPTPVTSWSNQIVVEVTPICPTTITNCTSGSVPGVQEYYFWRDYDICNAGNCKFNVSWTLCCRNGAITSGQANQNTYNGGTVYDTSLPTCNNSPVFTSIPIFYICAGMNTTGHQGAYDPDGDSLSYTLQACYSGNGMQVPYNPGYSPTSPLGTSWNVSLDPQSGELSFAANPGNLEVGVLCLQVNEYRNGQLIGQLWRDVQVRVMNCGANTNPTVGALTNNTTGIVAGDTIIIPTAGTSFCVDIPFTDPDTGQSLTAYWDGGIPGASFTQVGFPTVSDTIFGNAPVGRFCWTPPSNGVFNFLVTAEDTECPYPGWEDRLITVIVGNTGIFASAIPQGCNGYLLSVIPGGGVPPYTFSWSGTGGISTNPGANSAVFNHTFPGPGTYSYSVTVTGGGAYNQTISGTIVVPNIPPMNLIGQSGAVDQCRSSTLFLDAPSGFASYLWSNSDTARAISTTLPGNYWVIVTDSQGCQFSDTMAASLDSTTTAILGLAYTYDTLPLANTKIYMIFYNPVDSSLFVGDSTYTDSIGLYTFGCVPAADDVYLKAAPDSTTYPLNMPTYHFSSLTWQGADPYLYASQNWPVNILCQYGNNPGGPGFIGGLISQGANKRTDPVEGLSLWLVDQQGQAIANTTTNSDGYFSFPDLSYDTYSIWVDKPHVDNSMGPQVLVNSLMPMQDSLPFLLHTTWLEWVQATAIEGEDLSIRELEVIPNPFRESFALEFWLDQPGDVQVELMDMQGQEMGEVVLSDLPAGGHHFEHEGVKGLAPGIYFLRIRVGEESFVRKLLKL